MKPEVRARSAKLPSHLLSLIELHVAFCQGDGELAARSVEFSYQSFHDPIYHQRWTEQNYLLFKWQLEEYLSLQKERKKKFTQTNGVLTTKAKTNLKK